MGSDTTNQARLEQLKKQVQTLIQDRRRSGRFNYGAAYLLLILTLLFNTGASIAGFLNADPAVVGILALVPGLLTLTASELKLQARSHWHYRKRGRLQDLLTSIEFQTPDQPSAEKIHGLAEQFKVINNSMELEWEENLSLESTPMRQ